MHVNAGQQIPFEFSGVVKNKAACHLSCVAGKAGEIKPFLVKCC